MNFRLLISGHFLGNGKKSLSWETATKSWETGRQRQGQN